MSPWHRGVRLVVVWLAAGLLGVAGPALAAEQPATAEPQPPTPRGFVGWLENPVPSSLPFRLTGEVDIGGVKLEGNRNSPNFREYRVIEEGFVANRLRLGIESKDRRHFLEFQGQDISKNDQNYQVRGGEYGRYRLDFEWDQIPHIYALGAKTAFVRSEGGNYGFPFNIASAVQAAPTTPTKFAVLRQLNGATVFDLKTRNDIGKGAAWWAPAPEWDLQLSYDHTRRAGNRPIGAGFGSPGGSVVELPEPIEWQTDQLNASVGYSTPLFQLQGGYRLSIFGNDIKTMTYNNPLIAVSTFPAATSQSSIGRAVLAPDNQAHTAYLTGGVNLPMASRIAATVSYGLNFQNDTFISHTVNPVLAGDPRLRLYSPSLRGDLRTLLINATATTRPIRDVTVTGTYRFYDNDPHTLIQTFPAHVVRDTGPVVGETRFTTTHAYQKQNGDLDVAWRVLRPLTLRGGFGWERWDRDVTREVDRTDEYSAKAGIGYRPFSWLDAGAKYVRSWKRISFYNTSAHLSHTVVEEDIATEAAVGQSPQLRKYDEAARDRHRAEVSLRFTPFERLDIGLTGSYSHDNYPFSYLGLLNGNTWSVGADGSYAPFSWVTLRANYSHEEVHSKQRSRSRPVVAIGGVNVVGDFVSFDWISRNVDVYDTVGTGALLRLIPNKLDLQADWGYQRSIARVNSSNPVTPVQGLGPAAGQPAQRATATATSFPDDRFDLQRASGVLRYWLLKNLALRAGYTYEKFHVSYWQTDFIQPVNSAPPIAGASPISPLTAGSTVLDVFLGARPFRSYEAHIIGAGIQYGF